MALPLVVGSNPGSGGGGGAVTSVAGRTGAVVLTAADVGAGQLPVGVLLPSGVAIPSNASATTQAANDNSTKVATTAYADAIAALKANINSQAFTGTPSLPTGATGVTQAASDSSTKFATTAYVKSQLAIVPDRVMANAALFSWQGGGNQICGITALKPVFYPVDLYSLPSIIVSALSARVGIGTGGATVGIAIYSATYSAGPNISATLVAQLNATMAATAAASTVSDITTGAAGSGAATATLDFTTTRYIVGIMASDVATVRLWGDALTSTHTGLGVRSWTAAARSSVTDWPASFDQTSAVQLSVSTGIPVIDLVTATGKLLG